MLNKAAICPELGVLGLATEMIRADAGFHANQARGHREKRTAPNAWAAGRGSCVGGQLARDLLGAACSVAVTCPACGCGHRWTAGTDGFRGSRPIYVGRVSHLSVPHFTVV